jgi:hypothetical protein
MIATKVNGQSFASREKWSEIMDFIEEKWDNNYFITDFDFGDGLYRVLLSGSKGWNGQAIRFGKDFPEEKVDELWQKGYYITNVGHDGKDWIVIMSGIDQITDQTWFTRSTFEKFEESVSEYWAKGYDLTKVSYGNGMYLGVMSKGLNWGQSWWLWSEFPSEEILDAKQKEGKIITEIIQFDNKIFALTSSNTGYTKQRVHRNKDFERLRVLLNNRWDEDYSLTTVGYYNQEWILVLSK